MTFNVIKILHSVLQAFQEICTSFLKDYPDKWKIITSMLPICLAYLYNKSF